MNLNHYQQSALLFAADLDPNTALAVWSLGLGGEAGEVQELIKKHLGHGHDLPLDKVTKELGDVLWYVAVLAAHLGVSLDDVAAGNLAKLRERYPAGFDQGVSRGRYEAKRSEPRQ